MVATNHMSKLKWNKVKIQFSVVLATFQVLNNYVQLAVTVLGSLDEMKHFHYDRKFCHTALPKIKSLSKNGIHPIVMLYVLFLN